jgi:hypothetical protein
MFFIFNIKNMDKSKKWTSFCNYICIRDLTCGMKPQKNLAKMGLKLPLGLTLSEIKKNILSHCV